LVESLTLSLIWVITAFTGSSSIISSLTAAARPIAIAAVIASIVL